MKIWAWAPLLFLAAPALAVPEGVIPDYESGMSLGQAMIVGNQADRLTDSSALYFFWFKRLDPGFSAGFEMGYARGHTLKGKLPVEAPYDGYALPAGAEGLRFTSTVKSTDFWLTPQIKLGKSDEESNGSSLRPYAIFGGGLYMLANKGGTGTISGIAGGVDYTGTKFLILKKGDSFFGVNLGGGFTARLFTSFELAADIRYHYLFSGASSRQFLLPAARFNFLF